MCSCQRGSSEALAMCVKHDLDAGGDCQLAGDGRRRHGHGLECFGALENGAAGRIDMNGLGSVEFDAGGLGDDSGLVEGFLDGDAQGFFAVRRFVLNPECDAAALVGAG